MSVTIRPDEAHLGYAPERESWDPAFAGFGGVELDPEDLGNEDEC